MARLKKIVVGIVLLFLSYNFLTTDMDNIFECNKEKDICEHKTNTILKQTLITHKSFVLSSIESIEYKFYQTKSRGRKGRTKIKDHHDVMLTTSEGEIAFPIKAASAEKAQVIIDGFYNYAENSDENVYTYSDNTSAKFIITMFLLFLIGGLLFIRSAFKKAPVAENVEEAKGNTEEKKEEVKTEPKQETITRG